MKGSKENEWKKKTYTRTSTGSHYSLLFPESHDHPKVLSSFTHSTTFFFRSVGWLVSHENWLKIRAHHCCRQSKWTAFGLSSTPYLTHTQKTTGYIKTLRKTVVNFTLIQQRWKKKLNYTCFASMWYKNNKILSRLPRHIFMTTLYTIWFTQLFFVTTRTLRLNV